MLPIATSSRGPRPDALAPAEDLAGKARPRSNSICRPPKPPEALRSAIGWSPILPSQFRVSAFSIRFKARCSPFEMEAHPNTPPLASATFRTSATIASFNEVASAVDR